MPADCVPLQKDRAVLFHNRAVCYHCLDQTDAVIADATAALQLDPTYTRARAQRMNALAGPGATPPQLQTALADAAAVLAVDANHAAARHVQQTVPERLKRHEQEERDRMLGELKGLGNRILGQFGLSTDHFKFVEQPGGGYALNLQR
ncbi:hypothetical protein CXG81DRAFT_15862 [Caulochytrium protostelioides]|uniref:TPR-like protein n=1 Tax=Caulochytrium protostelioides TaxID=1555241 RepID=A0A4P9WYG0_9FUNG|nr:hypothetical protein CXG81DRAFT_15862 [Caulochytrium protostelioides]|eukprot:RKO98484.1 hypothetical protein CXG81DRAFT_15862 [Caulochytrium protostelioides]